jgi:hypothetical protein
MCAPELCVVAPLITFVLPPAPSLYFIHSQPCQTLINLRKMPMVMPEHGYVQVHCIPDVVTRVIRRNR